VAVHLAHVSSGHTVELLGAAKARGVRVTAETCPHYLFFTEEAVAGYDTRAKVNPPLRTADDVAALRQALARGVIDVLATDHAPHADHEKETEFMAAPCGISGLDTALAQTRQLVEQGIVDEARFLDAWCHAPARIFGLESCTFAQGDVLDFVLFDPSLSWEVTPKAMRSKGKNTPLAGKSLMGRVRHHCLAGRTVYRHS
jgi:dihydroorotase